MVPPTPCTEELLVTGLRHVEVQASINVDDLSELDSSQRTCKRETIADDAQPSVAMASATNPRDAKPFHEWEEAAIMGALVQQGGERALQNLKYRTKFDLVAALSHATEEGLPFITQILEVRAMVDHTMGTSVCKYIQRCTQLGPRSSGTMTILGRPWLVPYR